MEPARRLKRELRRERGDGGMMRREAEVEVGEMGTTEGFLESREEGRHLEQETDATVLEGVVVVCFGVLFFLEDGCSGVPLSGGQLCCVWFLYFFSFDLSSCSGICNL
jgi:hypothetical protein